MAARDLRLGHRIPWLLAARSTPLACPRAPTSSARVGARRAQPPALAKDCRGVLPLRSRAAPRALSIHRGLSGESTLLSGSLLRAERAALHAPRERGEGARRRLCEYAAGTVGPRLESPKAPSPRSFAGLERSGSDTFSPGFLAVADAWGDSPASFRQPFRQLQVLAPRRVCGAGARACGMRPRSLGELGTGGARSGTRAGRSLWRLCQARADRGGERSTARSPPRSTPRGRRGYRNLAPRGGGGDPDGRTLWAEGSSNLRAVRPRRARRPCFYPLLSLQFTCVRARGVHAVDLAGPGGSRGAGIAPRNRGTYGCRRRRIGVAGNSLQVTIAAPRAGHSVRPIGCARPGHGPGAHPAFFEVGPNVNQELT